MAAIEDASVQMVMEKEALKTAAVAAGTGERVRLHAQASQAEIEERRKQQDLFEQMDMELNQRMAALGDETFQRKKAMLDAEVVARRAKINREITDETNRAKLLQKLDVEQVKRTEILTKAETKFKTDAAFKVAADSITALQILNGMQEGHTKEEARRAKILLGLQQALAIANLWRAEAGKGVAGIAMATAGTAVLVAQFAAQSHAIDQARAAAASGNAQLQVTTPLPGGGSLDQNFGGVQGAPAVGGAGFAGPGVGGGGGGGGATTIINVGGVIVNFSADHVDLSEINTILRRIGDAARSGSIEGVRAAVSLKNAADKNAGLAV
jgi:hypothetical protein